jgi:hypothetical protein
MPGDEQVQMAIKKVNSLVRLTVSESISPLRERGPSAVYADVHLVVNGVQRGRSSRQSV